MYYIITHDQFKPSITLIPSNSQQQLQENICKQRQPQWLNQWSSEKNHTFLGLGYNLVFYCSIQGQLASFPLQYPCIHMAALPSLPPNWSPVPSLSDICAWTYRDAELHAQFVIVPPAGWYNVAVSSSSRSRMLKVSALRSTLWAQVCMYHCHPRWNLNVWCLSARLLTRVDHWIVILTQNMSHSQAAHLRNDVSSLQLLHCKGGYWNRMQGGTLPVTCDSNDYPCLCSLPSSKPLNAVSSQ